MKATCHLWPDSPQVKHGYEKKTTHTVGNIKQGQKKPALEPDQDGFWQKQSFIMISLLM